MDQAARGAAALSAGKFAEAIAELTLAIENQPQAVSHYIKRSTAYQRASPPELNLALGDAEKAVSLAYKRARRELIAEAQLRRSIALYTLGDYDGASFILQFVKKYNENEKSLPIWTKKIEAKMKETQKSESVIERQYSKEEIPDMIAKSKKSATITDSNVLAKAENAEQLQNACLVNSTQTPADKIRHEWYQNANNIYLTILAKGIAKDKTNIDILERSISVSFPTLNESKFDFALDPLFASVDVSESTSNILSTRVELVLKKVLPGQKWKALEAPEDTEISDVNLSHEDGHKNGLSSKAPEDVNPVYPTSSRSGPKDWDKVASELTQNPRVGDAESRGVNEIEEEDGDPVNAFFKKLYAGADPDTRRAMVKSYQESNGTALSTNWADVSKGPVETSPPDGMEAKKWGE